MGRGEKEGQGKRGSIRRQKSNRKKGWREDRKRDRKNKVGH